MIWAAARREHLAVASGEGRKINERFLSDCEREGQQTGSTSICTPPFPLATGVVILTGIHHHFQQSGAASGFAVAAAFSSSPPPPMSTPAPPSPSINPRKRDFASLNSNSDRQRSRALKMGHEQEPAAAEPELKVKRVISCPSPATAAVPLVEQVSELNAAPAGLTHEQPTLSLASLYRMSDQDLLAFAGRMPSSSRPIEGTLADCKQVAALAL